MTSKIFPSFLCITLFLLIVYRPYTAARRLSANATTLIVFEPKICAEAHPSRSAPVGGYRSLPSNRPSIKPEKPLGSQFFKEVKEETVANINTCDSMVQTSKAAPKKPSHKAAQRSKRKGKASKPQGKQ